MEQEHFLLTFGELGAEATVRATAVGAETHVDDVSCREDERWGPTATHLGQEREQRTGTIMDLHHRERTDKNQKEDAGTERGECDTDRHREGRKKMGEKVCLLHPTEKQL